MAKHADIRGQTAFRRGAHRLWTSGSNAWLLGATMSDAFEGIVNGMFRRHSSRSMHCCLFCRHTRTATKGSVPSDISVPCHTDMTLAILELPAQCGSQKQGQMVDGDSWASALLTPPGFQESETRRLRGPGGVEWSGGGGSVATSEGPPVLR